MLRNDLLEKNYHFEKKEPGKAVINILWLFFAALFVAPAVLIFGVLLKDDSETLIFDAAVINIIFAAAPLIYFGVKAALTALFCSDDKKVYLKLTKNTGMPVWACREAFQAWQIILMYLPPVVLIYPILLILSMMSGGEISLLVLIIIMSFFMTYDLTLIIYLLFLKKMYKPDYIAIDEHVYTLTLYYKTYIERENKRVVNFKLPKFRFNFNFKFKINKRIISIISILSIFAGLMLVLFVGLYINNKKMPENDSGEAIIKGYNGNPFADTDIFLAGKYVSGKWLAGGNILFCADYQLVIYYDDEKDSLMYLLDSMGQIRKLCVYDNCEKNRAGYCGHAPNFLNDGCFTDCYLYGAVNLHGVENSYIVRYDVDFNKIEKLFEFDMYDENVYIQKMTVHGRYLYVILAIGDLSYLEIARIDLENEDACVLYSDNKDSTNKEKVSGTFRFYGNYMISVSSGNIYKCDLDLRNFETLTEANNVRQFDISFDDYVYYCDTESRKLYRCNIKTKKSELLLDGAFRFYIDGFYLYYTLREKHDTKDDLGIIVSSEFYDDDIIYRTALDTEYIDFYNKVEAYKPEQGYHLGDWGVEYNGIYALLYSDKGDNILCRKYAGSTISPFIFWKKTLK